jgi:hypothetical protein
MPDAAKEVISPAPGGFQGVLAKSEVLSAENEEKKGYECIKK